MGLVKTIGKSYPADRLKTIKFRKDLEATREKVRVVVEKVENMKLAGSSGMVEKGVEEAPNNSDHQKRTIRDRD